MQVVDRLGTWCFVAIAAAVIGVTGVTGCAGIEDPGRESFGAFASAPTYPLRRGPEGTRYLVDQHGAPFLWTGDTAWSLIAQLTASEAEHYLSDRQAKGFNVVLVNLLEHRFATRAPANIAGELPFAQRAFVAPNERYFAHADAVIRAAGTRGIAVLLAPLYLGWGCGSEGWCGEVARASESELYAWGRYVGTRYRDFDNIVWLVGGDADPSPVRAKVLAMVRGIRDTDSRHLFTAHNDVTSARSRWPDQDWLSIDNIYSYSASLHENGRAAYGALPAMPFFLLESSYENEHGVAVQQLRAQAYWTMLSGGMGQIFGNCPIWHFGASSSWCGSTDWKSNLQSGGSTSMMHLHRLFSSRPWHTLIPDFGSAVVTQGLSSGSDRAVAARASDGGTVIAYLPSPRPVTVNMSQISGTHATVWWYSPSSGIAEQLGTYLTSGSRTFSPPGGDSVLVLDDASRGFPPPGGDDPEPSPPPPSSPPSTPPSLGASDVVVNFESVPENVVLSNEGGISWPTSGTRWRVWDGGSRYSKNAFIDSTARGEVTATFALPNGAVLKSLRIAVGSGRNATSVKISSPGNAERVYTDIGGTYATKSVDWATPASTITLKVICDTVYGASDLAFDAITYLPAKRSQ